MVVITVSGSRSGVGKTTLCALLLGRLDGYAAVKVSTGGMYTSVTDVDEVIDERDKDTHILKEAGACPVVLVRCPAEELGDALEQVFVLVGGASGVVVEGNGPARLLKADVSFFVTGPDVSDAKAGALELMGRADVVVVNVEETEPPEATAEKIRKVNRKAAITTMGLLREGCPELDGLAGSL